MADSCNSCQKKSFKVDASVNGCTGMFYRNSPKMDDTSSDPDWPRNGTIVKGMLCQNNKGWVHLDNGFWLPVEQHGNTVTHLIQ